MLRDLCTGNHEGYDSFFLFFNETDGENTNVDSPGAAPLPHPMTSLLRTGTALASAAAGGVPSGTPRWFSLQIGLVHLVGKVVVLSRFVALAVSLTRRPHHYCSAGLYGRLGGTGRAKSDRSGCGGDAGLAQGRPRVRRPREDTLGGCCRPLPRLLLWVPDRHPGRHAVCIAAALSEARRGPLRGRALALLRITVADRCPAAVRPTEHLYDAADASAAQLRESAGACLRHCRRWGPARPRRRGRRYAWSSNGLRDLFDGQTCSAQRHASDLDAGCELGRRGDRPLDGRADPTRSVFHATRPAACANAEPSGSCPGSGAGTGSRSAESGVARCVPTLLELAVRQRQPDPGRGGGRRASGLLLGEFL